MPKLSAIAPSHTQEVTVAIGEETVVLTVASHKITPGLIVTMNKMIQTDDIAAMDGLLGFLETTIEGWDITGEDDKPLPVTAEVLGTMPLPVLMELSKGVMEGITAGNDASSPA